MATPQERIAQLMDDYDIESSDSDEIAQTIAADPTLVAALTRNQRRLLVLGLFDGPTDESEEDSAMTILRGANVTDLKWIIGQIGWSKLDDELDDEDIAELRGRSGDLTGFDPTDDDADDVAEIIANNPSLLSSMSVHDKVLLVKALFDGDTGEAQEDAAMKILMSMTASELQNAVNQIGWDELDSELDDEDIAKLRGRTGDLTGFDPTDDDADEVAVFISNDPALLGTMSLANKILLIRALFDGPTDEDEEDAAMRILRSMSLSDVREAVRQLGWPLLESELDVSDIIELRKRTLDFKDFDPTDDDSDEIAMSFANDPDILTQLNRDQRALLVRALFDGPTSEEEEDAAVRILLSEPTGEGLVQLVCDVGGWGVLDDELDSDAIDQLTQTISSRLDSQWAPLRGVMPWLYTPNLSLFTNPASDSVQSMIFATPADQQRSMIDTALARRMAMLTRVSSLRRRGKSFPADVLFQSLDWLSTLAQYKIPECRQLRFEVRYLNNLAQDLANSSYEPLINVLADLVDATLSVEQRTALFEMLRWLEPEHEAQRSAVDLLGNADQKARMQRFMNVRRVFLNTFNPALPPATVLSDVLQALRDLGEAVTGGISELRTMLGVVGNDVISALALSSILGTDDDDNARALISLLASLEQDGTSILARLPLASKQKLINTCLSGSAGDEDEIAVNKIFNATDEMDRAEFFQLMNAVTFETISFNIDGDEWESFMALLSCGANRLGTSSGALVTLMETKTGTNVLFRNTWTGRVYSTEEACTAIIRNEIPGYTVQNRNGRRTPVSAADNNPNNNLRDPVRSRLVS